MDTRKSQIHHRRVAIFVYNGLVTAGAPKCCLCQATPRPILKKFRVGIETVFAYCITIQPVNWSQTITDITSLQF